MAAGISRKGAPSPSRSAAIQELLASETAVQTGHYGRGIELAQQSTKDFAHARNRAGMLRAALAAMAAQDFALKYADCLRTAAGTLPILAKTRYPLAAGINVSIEQRECLAGTANLQQAIESNRRGWELADQAHYPELTLRATSFGASYLLNTGRPEEGLRGLRSGLATFWQSDVSDMPGENLYSCLFDASDGIDWPFVDAFAQEEKLQRFPSRDPVDQAVDREFIAGAQARAGDYRAAQETLKSAAADLDSLPNDRDVASQGGNCGGPRKIQLRIGDAHGAITSLAPFREDVETTRPGRSQAQYFKTLGEAYLRLGKQAEARPLLERALAVRETGLRNLQQEADKLAWSRGRGELYRDLLEIALKSKTSADAFALWESYKGASLRPAAAVESLASPRRYPFFHGARCLCPSASA